MGIQERRARIVEMVARSAPLTKDSAVYV